MTITISSQELNQDLTCAKPKALKGLVVAEAQSLTGGQRSIVEALADTAQESSDIEFAPVKLDIELKPVKQS